MMMSDVEWVWVLDYSLKEGHVPSSQLVHRLVVLRRTKTLVFVVPSYGSGYRTRIPFGECHAMFASAMAAASLLASSIIERRTSDIERLRQMMARAEEDHDA
jgi:hypothetical protein